jgi:large subunit ribosomal protein L4
MQISVYTATGTKSGSLELPAGLFEAPVNKGLMHLALIRQQSNRRCAIAHVKNRGEIVGSTKKLFKQKHTGKARRGPIRSPLMKGGGKAFGPRNNANFIKEMPKKMRRAALFSCLSFRAQEEGALLALENYGGEVKTKTFMSLFEKLPVIHGRKIVFVVSEKNPAFELSARNVPGVKILSAKYLNPEDILGAKNIVFFVDAVKLAEETFLAPVTRGLPSQDETTSSKEPSTKTKAAKTTKAPAVKKAPAKKPAAKKTSSTAEAA